MKAAYITGHGGNDVVEFGDRPQPRRQAGDVLVTDMTDPNWEPVMKRASAIVTNRRRHAQQGGPVHA